VSHTVTKYGLCHFQYLMAPLLQFLYEHTTVFRKTDLSLSKVLFSYVCKSLFVRALQVQSTTHCVVELLIDWLIDWTTSLRRFSCKLEKFNEKPLKRFSLHNMKHLLRIFTWLNAADRGDLWCSSLEKDGKCPDWTSCWQNCIKWQRPIASVVVVDWGLWTTSGVIGLKLVCWQKMSILNAIYDANCDANRTDLEFYWLITLASFLWLIFHKIV